MAVKNPSWSKQWIEYLEQESFEEAIHLLNQQTGEKRQTPNSTVKSKAITIAIQKLQPNLIYKMACHLAIHEHPTAKEIAAYLLIAVYEENPSNVMGKLLTLADDEDWEVREWAASACGKQLIDDFDRFYSHMEQWVTHESANVRRAAALAVKYACKTKNLDWADPLLALIEPLLKDGDPYVKKNLGPFTLGDALLRAYPEETLHHLMKWNERDDINTRWNIAKVFTTAEGAKMADQAIPILKVLMRDERTDVQRAVKSAMNNLEKRQPKIYEQLQKESSH